MTVTDDDIRKIARDVVVYAADAIEPVFVYWSKHNKKFSKSPLRNLRGEKTSHIVGVYDQQSHPHMVEDDIRHWIANRPRQEN